MICEAVVILCFNCTKVYIFARFTCWQWFIPELKKRTTGIFPHFQPAQVRNMDTSNTLTQLNNSLLPSLLLSKNYTECKCLKWSMWEQGNPYWCFDTISLQVCEVSQFLKINPKVNNVHAVNRQNKNSPRAVESDWPNQKKCLTANCCQILKFMESFIDILLDMCRYHCVSIHLTPSLMWIDHPQRCTHTS